MLLLPTFAAGAETWGVAVVRALADRSLVLRPDWPGIGRSPPSPRGPYTIAALADAVLTAVEPYTAGPFLLAGWGFGALVALRLAIDRPDRLDRLALLGGATHGGALLAGTPTVAALCRVAQTASAEEYMLGLLGRIVSPAWRPFAEMFLAQLLPRPARTLAALRQQWAALQDCDLRSGLDRIRSPTLVLAGDADTLTTPDHARRLQSAIPGARLRTVAGAGHAAIWEQPAAVLDELLSFFEGDAIDGHAATRGLRTAGHGREVR